MPYADRSLLPTSRKRAAVVCTLAVLLLCNATLLILLMTGELDLSIKQAADQSVAGPVDGNSVVGTEDAPRSDTTPKPITSDFPAVRPLVSPVVSKPDAVPRVGPEDVEQTSVDPPKADPDDALPKFFGL